MRVAWKNLAQSLLACLLLLAPVREFAAADLPAVNAAPRLALIIGNGKYQDVPLKNAPNDARSMAELLQRMGFEVTLKLDASRTEMINTIRDFGGWAEVQKRHFDDGGVFDKIYLQ